MRHPAGRLKDYLLCALRLGPSPRAQWAILWRETKNLRVRLKLGAYHPRQGYSLDTICGRLHFRDNFGDITNLLDLFYYDVYRVRPLQQPGAILDIGANTGLAAALYARHNPGRDIYCFEPLAANAAMIGLNCPSAWVEQVAVGARRERVRLNVDPDGVMASDILPAWDTDEVEFEVLPLDDYCRAAGLEQIALIKIDVEGMEIEALEGGRETLQRAHEVVMETHSRRLHDETVERLRLAGFGVDAEQFDGATGMVFASNEARRLRRGSQTEPDSEPDSMGR